MISAIRLEPIVPYNEIFYKGCFFNSLFSMLSYFGTDEIPLLFNDMIVYERCEETGRIQVTYKGFRETEALLLEQGIRMATFDRVDDLISALQQSIQDGKPAIVSVDSYYIPGRKDTFHTKHWPHSLLVFGFDLGAQTFDIVEHKNSDSLTYAKRSIPFEDMVKAFEGYIASRELARSRELASWPEMEAPLYAEFAAAAPVRAGGAKCDPAVASEFDQMMAKHRGWMSESLEALRQFIEQFQLLVNDERAIKGCAEPLLMAMTDIINAKQVERFRLERTSDRYPELLDALRTIIIEWNMIRAVIGKLLFSGIYKRDDLVDISKHFERIAALEIEIADRWDRVLT